MGDYRKGKSEILVESIRSGIVSGAYPPGHRLPPMSKLCGEFGIGIATVQRAFSQLVEDGFVEMGARRQGTFVVKRPPHLFNYALLMPAEGAWSRYYTGIYRAAEQVARDKSIRFVEYKISRDVKQQGETLRLRRDLAASRLAGVLSVASPRSVAEMSLLGRSDIPRVFLQHDEGFGAPSVLLDYNAFLKRAVDYLLGRGRRRIAHLQMEFPWHVVKEFEAKLKSMGLEARPYWHQGIPMSSLKHTAANIVNVMMQLEGPKRPDALIIYDDNLIEQADAGLLAAGVRVPEDLEVVALCNFPAPVPSEFPIKRLGLDCRLVLEECLRTLDMQRRAETPPAMQWIPPLFDDEVRDSPARNDSEG